MYWIIRKIYKKESSISNSILLVSNGKLEIKNQKKLKKKVINKSYFFLKKISVHDGIQTNSFVVVIVF